MAWRGVALARGSRQQVVFRRAVHYLCRPAFVVAVADGGDDADVAVVRPVVGVGQQSTDLGLARLER